VADGVGVGWLTLGVGVVCEGRSFADGVDGTADAEGIPVGATEGVGEGVAIGVPDGAGTGEVGSGDVGPVTVASGFAGLAVAA
jgi:hypothetical protein